MQRILVVREGDSLQVFEVASDDDLGDLALEIIRSRCASGFYQRPAPFPSFGIPDEVMATYTGATSLELLMLRSWEHHKQELSVYALSEKVHEELHRVAEFGDKVAAISFLLNPTIFSHRSDHSADILVLSSTYTPPPPAPAG